MPGSGLEEERTDRMGMSSWQSRWRLRSSTIALWKDEAGDNGADVDDADEDDDGVDCCCEDMDGSGAVVVAVDIDEDSPDLDEEDTGRTDLPLLPFSRH